MRKAVVIELDDAQREKLVKLAHSNTTEVRLARRAGIVLLAADGLDNRQIGELLGVGRVQVGRWRERYAAGGLRAIEQDLPRSGRKPKIDAAEIVRLTTQTKPEGATQWSTRKLAAVTRGERTPRYSSAFGRRSGLKPHRVEGLQGLARSEVRREARRHRRSVPVAARARAGAVLRREEPGAGARSHPAGPAAEAGPGRHHDPRLQAPRHHHAVRGDEHLRRHRSSPAARSATVILEWLDFLRQINRETPHGQGPASDLRQLRDAQASRRSRSGWPSIRASTSTSPRPRRRGSTWSSASSAASRPDRLQRGVFRSVPELIAAIEEYIAMHNQNPKPFVWTAKANDILARRSFAPIATSVRRQNEALH